MNDPYATSTLDLTADDRAAWRAYEAANRAAAEQYEALPIAHCRAGQGSPCRQCHVRATRNTDGICPTCNKETR